MRDSLADFEQIEAPVQADRVRRRRSLVYPGYGAGLSLLLAGMAVSIVLLGLTMPYYNKAASDMVSVYEALLYNSGRAQEFLVYPAVPERVLLGLWLGFLHAIGLIPISRLEELKPLADIKAYDAQWQTLVEAGRVYALLTGMACVAAIVVLVKRWLGVWQIAVLAGVGVAFSSGVALGFRILRPEMVAATLTFSALLVTIVSAREPRLVCRLAGLALAGFLVALSILEKVQSLIPVLAILPLAIAFGTPGAARGEVRSKAAWQVAAALVITAGIAVGPAFLILQTGMAQMGTANAEVYRPLMGGLSGVYQPATAGLVVLSMAAYGAIWRVGAAETLAGIAAAAFGLACGIDLLYLQSSPQAIIAIANPIEHLQGLSAGTGRMLLSQEPSAVIATMIAAVGRSLAIHTFFMNPIHRPTLLIEWLSLAGMLYAWHKGRTLMALQILLLVGCAIAEDAIFSLRQVKVYYLPYSDIPIVLAGALALSQFKYRLMRPAFERATLALMIGYIVWGHAQPALAVYSRHDKGKVCGIVVLFTKQITIPYCPLEPKP